MKKAIYSTGIILICVFGIFAQKGVDPQNRRIQQEGTKTNQTTPSTADTNSNAYDFGSGKTKVRPPLANPYKLNARRDVLIETVRDVLESMKILIDDAASRPQDGIIVTQPFVFAKGAVVARSELSRYAFLPASDTSWTRGRFTLTVEVQTIDGIQNNVSVVAKVEGRSENGLESEWTTLESSGNAEDEFLVKLVEAVTGTLIDGSQEKP